VVTFGSALLMGGPPTAKAADPYLGPFHTVTTLSSTVPANGDVNPYGVFVVPRSVGKLVQGDVLVSNFNNSMALRNQQGRGTTIVQVAPSGQQSLFATVDAQHLPGACPGGVGLTTALVVLQRGWVIVGSLPTSDGTSATMQAGCLLVLNSGGQVVETFAGQGINGPWDMTVRDTGGAATLFVTNVLNGTVAANGAVVNRGTVLRLALDVPQPGQDIPQRNETTVIGSGFAERTDPAALVVGPTGVGLGQDGMLYVADTASNRLTAIRNALTRDASAGTGTVVTANGSLNGPLGLVVAPNGDLLSVNGGDGNIVETTPAGVQVAVRLLNNTAPIPSGGAGALFGLAVVPGGGGVYFVDDDANALNRLQQP
jgi:hypothetical protein